MKVLHILNTRHYSGAENIVCQIIQLMSKNEDIDMVYCSPSGPISNFLNDNNIIYAPVDRLSIRELRRVIKEHNPDVIHAHDFRASVYAALFLRIPVISHIHCNPLWLSKICVNSLLYALCSLRFSKILGVSDAVKNDYVFRNFIEKKYCTIGNVVDVRKMEQKLIGNKVEDVYDLIYVGRLETEKNPLKFLQIVKDVSRKQRVRAVMLGEGRLKEECLRYIKKYNLADSVELIGFVGNPYVYMNNSKIVVIPSIYEGFGLVAVEAMVLGLPVICSGVGGLNDIINDECGKKCSCIKEYVEIIIKLLNNKNMYLDYSHHAKLNAKKYIDVGAYKEMLKCVYNEI